MFSRFPEASRHSGYQTASSAEPSAPVKPGHGDLRLQIVFVFLIVYAGLLFIVRPHPTVGQVIFRASVAGIGLLGLGWVENRRRSRR
jgi:hypothetical protein